MIADGTLDKRLFNVTALVEAGYHDGARDDVPVLVSYRENASPGIRARTTADGAAVETRSLAAISGAASIPNWVIRARPGTAARPIRPA